MTEARANSIALSPLRLTHELPKFMKIQPNGISLLSPLYYNELSTRDDITAFRSTISEVWELLDRRPFQICPANFIPGFIHLITYSDKFFSEAALHFPILRNHQQDNYHENQHLQKILDLTHNARSTPFLGSLEEQAMSKALHNFVHLHVSKQLADQACLAKSFDGPVVTPEQASDGLSLAAWDTTRSISQLVEFCSLEIYNHWSHLGPAITPAAQRERTEHITKCITQKTDEFEVGGVEEAQRMGYTWVPDRIGGTDGKWDYLVEDAKRELDEMLVRQGVKGPDRWWREVEGTERLYWTHEQHFTFLSWGYKLNNY